MKSLSYIAPTLVGLGLSLALALPAQAGATATLEVTKPLGAGTVTLTFTANGVTQTVTVPDIKATDTAAAKCEKIKAKLQSAGFAPGGTCPKIEIQNLPSGIKVTWDPGKTGEGKDQLTVVAGDTGTPPATAAISFAGTFNGVGGDRRPASFTAGVLTDVAGGVTVTYTLPAGVLAVDGRDVAAHLYSMLVQAIADAGLDVGVALDTDTLFIEFGPGDGFERGVVAGTTATNNGVVASVN